MTEKDDTKVLCYGKQQMPCYHSFHQLHLSMCLVCHNHYYHRPFLIHDKHTEVKETQYGCIKNIPYDKHSKQHLVTKLSVSFFTPLQ